MLRNWRVVGWMGLVLLTTGLIGSATAGAGAVAGLPGASGLTIAGAVRAPATYSLAQLAALPQTAVQVPGAASGTRAHLDRGVSLEALVDAAQPVLPPAKNALLRLTVTVTADSGRRVTFALGELDPNFGDHPALLVLTEDGVPVRASPVLVVPGDSAPTRSLTGVVAVAVAVHSPAPAPPPSPGAVTVRDGTRAVVLDARRLARLPAETLTVSFLGGGAAQQHTETGPALATVLAAGGFSPASVAGVAAVGSDGYLATATPAEAPVGGRPLILATRQDGAALAQPRLVVDGDVKGGRYVSDVVDLVVGLAPPAA